MTRLARFVFLVLLGLAASGVVLLGALAALAVALGTAALNGAQAATTTTSRDPRPHAVHQPVAELGLAA